VGNKLQKKESFALKEKAQYVMTFGVIATMLVIAQFPMIVIFFFGIFAFFLWKTFSQPTHKGVREVFEFYLAANEILRDDDRRWFGFEVRNAIDLGEAILQKMHGAPPLVYFALGALYNRLGDHSSAVNHLAYVVENPNADESTYLHPSGDLRDYVRLLRKIEADPKEAPQTASAIRTLERLRRNKGVALLAESRELDREHSKAKEISAKDVVPRPEDHLQEDDSVLRSVTEAAVREQKMEKAEEKRRGKRLSRFRRHAAREEEDFSDRKPISEVLHDIYDKNVQ